MITQKERPFLVGGRRVILKATILSTGYKYYLLVTD